jgi:hypothetical protein
LGPMMMTMMMMMLTTTTMMMMITITGDPVRLGANITLTRAHAKNNLQSLGLDLEFRAHI